MIPTLDLIPLHPRLGNELVERGLPHARRLGRGSREIADGHDAFLPEPAPLLHGEPGHADEVVR